MNEPKFKVGEVVLYQNGDRFEIGVVKRIVPQPFTRVVVGSDPVQTYEDHEYSYFCWYHMGDTCACTPEDCLHKIQNAYAFTVLRRSVEPEIQNDPCRQAARIIIEAMEERFHSMFGGLMFNNYTGEVDENDDEIIEEGEIGDALFYEDVVTEKLHTMPTMEGAD